VSPPKLRCAVYTRKSSEEGLEQSFNSLHAQREACEAYIQSQKGEGWTLVRTAYDDGGFSGGNLARPALKALLDDIEAGRIDVVVVYKVDRLTRSLTDFARIVDTFDRRGVSFVSITQAFNTTTSMGRLTLNVLLSFAQFEREVTGERIRDKIAASKAKGIWMGGNPPLGYDIGERKLVINPPEADTVRHIFQRYLELSGVNALATELERDGVRSKCWTSVAGKVLGGQPISRGALFHTLKNRIYLGLIVHKGVTYAGEHPAILPGELFDAVQAKIAAMAGERTVRAKTGAALLKGLVFDQDGASMSCTTARGRHGRTFRYYVSASLQQGGQRNPDDEAVRRVSAPQLENLVVERLRCLGLSETPAVCVRRVELRSHALVISLGGKSLLGGYANAKAALAAQQMRLPQNDQLVAEPSGGLRLVIDMRPVFRGGRTWLVNPTNGADATAKAKIDQRLVAALKQAHAWLAEHNALPMAKLEVLRTATLPPTTYARKAIQFALLAPDIQEAIVEGRQPPGLTFSQVMERGVPIAWADQRARFGFPASAPSFP